MFSRPLAFVLLALATLTAAAGGAYVANRNNARESAAVVTPATTTQPSTALTPATSPAGQPVAETEAAVTPSTAPAVTPEKPEPTARVAAATKRADAKPARAVETTRTARRETPPASTSKAPAAQTPSSNGVSAATAPAVAAPTPAPPAAAFPEPARPIDPQPEPPRAPQFEELILPASSVISLQMESTLSSERARVEDRVDARVTRDVLSGGRVAIPAGSRVLGSVTEVERGGKVKERARLGVRFHTLVLGDGSEVPLRTEPVYRDGESPAGDTTKKVGGAAVGGAILGAILGGKKGAAIGAATGVAGGTAAVMAGDRNAATLSRGEVVTPKLSAPATITVERRE